jgi:signal peptidase II
MRLSIAGLTIRTAPVADMRFLQTTVQDNRRVILIALLIIILDQLTKLLVSRLLPNGIGEKVIIEGFFKFVHWGNTGAAWSLFRGNNVLLAIVAGIALIVLALSRHHFHGGTPLGRIAFGLIFGGIVGNLIDRIRVHHVIDFIFFFIERPDGTELGFPAFNIADTAICTGVGLIFLTTLLRERRSEPVEPAADA